MDTEDSNHGKFQDAQAFAEFILKVVPPDSVIGFEEPSTMGVLLNHLKWYISAFEHLLEKKLVQIKKQYGDSDNYDEQQIFEDEISVMEVLFANLLRSSFFLSLYALFEYSFVQRCIFIEKSLNASVLLDDIAGRGIVRCEKYLEKVGRIEIKKLGEWEVLLRYNELRNCIAHTHGYLNQKSQDLIKFVKDNPHLDIDGGQVVVKKGFCGEAIDTMERFFDGVDAQLPGDYQDHAGHYGYRLW